MLFHSCVIITIIIHFLAVLNSQRFSFTLDKCDAVVVYSCILNARCVDVLSLPLLVLVLLLLLYYVDISVLFVDVV